MRNYRILVGIILLFCFIKFNAQNITTYQYSPEGWLLQSSDGNKTQIYTYDELGNRTGYEVISNNNLSDLEILTPSANPVTVVAGSTTNISCTIKNNGSSSTGAASMVGYYLSTNTYYEVGDILLANKYISSIAANTSFAISKTVNIPSGTASGAHYILVMSDYLDAITESNENNNTSFVQISVSGTTVPFNNTVQNVSTVSTSEDCYDATNTITVAGLGTSVDINSGSNAIFIAGGSVYLKDGFHSHSGSHSHTYITQTGDYCSLQQSMIAVTPNELPGEDAYTKEVEVENNEEEINLTIYPNPTQGEFVIDFVGDKINAKISMHNYFGVNVYSTEVFDQTMERVNISDLPEGVYIIIIEHNSKMIFSKVVKTF